ncbi:MAG: NAD(P)-dependent oxidoreductase, partial [Sediminibacterium sp.]|nr:NAD(P)-dependent oxidoreductase [Sediminibacterium sp.]
MVFKNKTVFITGASRGIGKAIALQLAAAGANIVVAAKSVQENPTLGGTIFSVVEEIKSIGGNALAVELDVRNEIQIQAAVEKTMQTFNGIDIVINNASALFLANTTNTESKKFDLMYNVNVRGSFLVTKYCLPFLKKGNNPHIITMSPPINLNPIWLKDYATYTITKYGMSLLAMGWATEFKEFGIASNSLWPKTIIATKAVENNFGGIDMLNKSRKPTIIADAVLHICKEDATNFTGNNLIDEDYLKTKGITDFSKYNYLKGATLFP